MRGRGRVDDEALGISYVRQVREELQRLDEFPSRFPCVARLWLYLERHHRPGSLRQVLLGELVVRMLRQPCVEDSVHERMLAQELGDGRRILHMPIHAKREGLQAL